MITDRDLPTSAAAQRNRDSLTDVLSARLPTAGAVLEVASGTGQHAAHWAATLTQLVIQPSDADADALEAIEAWRRAAAAPNLRAPFRLDVAGACPSAAQGPWDAIVAVNLVHISPWAASEGLMAGAGATLAAAGRLFLYGPYAEDGRLEPASNRTFDRSLRARDPNWGIRDIADLRLLAQRHGLGLSEQVAMPANNRVLVFDRVPCA